MGAPKPLKATFLPIERSHCDCSRESLTGILVFRLIHRFSVIKHERPVASINISMGYFLFLRQAYSNSLDDTWRAEIGTGSAHFVPPRQCEVWFQWLCVCVCVCVRNQKLRCTIENEVWINPRFLLSTIPLCFPSRFYCSVWLWWARIHGRRRLWLRKTAIPCFG